MNSDWKEILYSEDAGMARVTLNRPQRLGSFTETMHKELRRALKMAALAVEQRRVRVLVITGKGKGFCAGQDLQDRKEGEKTGLEAKPFEDSSRKLGLPKQQKPDLAASLEKHYNPLIKMLLNFPAPTLAAVNGVAAGAGISLALACDFVLASQQASFVFAFSKIGLIPDSGCSFFLPYLVGLQKAKQLSMLGESISAVEAERIGLIYKALPAKTFYAEQKIMEQKLFGMAIQALTHTRSLLLSALENSLETQLDDERAMQGFLGQEHEYTEGVQAFLEKRKASFKENE